MCVAAFRKLLTHSSWNLILGGAALQRCDNGLFLAAALAAEVKLQVAKEGFSAPVDLCRWITKNVSAL